jgi:hypothetical protein
VTLTVPAGARRSGRRPCKVTRPAGRPAQPSLDEEPPRRPRRQRLYATVGSNSNVGGERHGGGRGPRARSGRSTRERRQAPLRERAAQSRTAWLGAGRAARCGPRSTSATSSAATSCPTT